MILSHYRIPILRQCTAQKVPVFGVILVRIFPHQTECGEILRMRENVNQNNYEHGHFSRSGNNDNVSNANRKLQ